jgi:membrane protein YdbS with pleckstrin-like domain
MPRTREQPTSNAEPIWEGHPATLGMLYPYYYKRGRWTILLSALLIGLAALGAIGLGLAILSAVVMNAIMIGFGLMLRRTTIYQVTQRRVLSTTGILSRRTESAEIRRIENVTFEQSIIERLMGIGRIDFDTAGEHVKQGRGAAGSTPYLYWYGVRNPRAVVSTVDHILDELYETRTNQASHVIESQEQRRKPLVQDAIFSGPDPEDDSEAVNGDEPSRSIRDDIVVYD